MAKEINEIILANFILNEKFTRKIIPHFKSEYFANNVDKIIFEQIELFVDTYNAPPSKEALVIAIKGNAKFTGENVVTAIEFIEGVEKDYEKPNFEWLCNTSEKFCKDQAVVNALMESIRIIDGDSKDLSKDAIPDILSKALAVGFNTAIGHDYFENAAYRYDQYSIEEDRIKFDISILNKITRGGLPGKTLTLFLGGTGTGKTHVMCHLATAYLKDGKNVIYITLEMSEEKISERIDANMLNVNIGELNRMGKEAFTSRLNSIEKKTQGKLIVKEYPMHGSSAANFKALIDELAIKKSFKPDVVIVDYLGICASSRYRNSKGINTNTFYQSVAEELRALGQYYDIPIISSVQTNRSGSTNSELGLTDMADSFGVAFTGDLVIGLVTNEELSAESKLMMRVLKNRFNALDYYGKFLVGSDRPKFRLYDLEDDVNEKPTYAIDDEEDEIPFFSNSNKKPDTSNFKF